MLVLYVRRTESKKANGALLATSVYHWYIVSKVGGRRFEGILDVVGVDRRPLSAIEGALQLLANKIEK